MSHISRMQPLIIDPVRGGCEHAFEFAVADRVLIDGHRDIKGIVTGLAHFEKGDKIRVEWFASGARHTEWFSPSRLTLAEDA